MLKLTKIVGKDNISMDEIDKIVYASDASQIEGKVKAVVWVENEKQISKIIKYATSKKIDIVTRGGGTDLVGSVVPKNSIILDLSKMNKVIKVDGEIVTVEPGVILNDLNNYLENLFFPVIPASHGICTIGGMISTNAAGLRAIKYGRMNKWVSELDIIDGTGKKIKLKGKDAEDFCGTEGTAGIIIKAKLKLTEPIKRTTVSFLKFDNLKDMINSIEKNENVVALEFIGKKTAELAGLENKNYLLTEFESNEGEIKDISKIEEVWKLRDGLFSSLVSNGYIIIEDPRLPENKLLEFLTWLSENNIPHFGHIGDGIIHPHFKEGQKELVKEMFKIVKKIGGEVSGEHGIGLTKKDFISQEMIKKFREIKKKYDPNNIFNVGKII